MQKIGKKISVTIPDRLIKAAECIAEDSGCTVAQVYRNSIRLALLRIMKGNDELLDQLRDEIRKDK